MQERGLGLPPGLVDRTIRPDPDTAHDSSTTSNAPPREVPRVIPPLTGTNTTLLGARPPLSPAAEEVVSERETQKKRRIGAESRGGQVEQARSSHAHTRGQHDRGDRRRKDANWEDLSSRRDRNESSYGRIDAYTSHREDSRRRSRSRDRWDQTRLALLLNKSAWIESITRWAVCNTTCSLPTGWSSRHARVTTPIRITSPLDFWILCGAFGREPCPTQIPDTD